MTEKIRLRISEIYNKTSLALIGKGLSTLKLGQKISIVSIRKSNVKGTNAPLVLKKKDITIYQITDYYAIGKTLTYSEEIESYSGLAALTQNLHPVRKTVIKNETLNVNENDLLGTPALDIIEIGDWVIPPDEIKEFVNEIVKGEIDPYISLETT